MQARRPLAPADRFSGDAAADLLFEGAEPAPAARARRRLAPGRALLGAARRTAFWAPVALPLALLAQTVLGGLGPARAEDRRLGEAEQRLERRLASAEHELDEYRLRLRAYRDPIYLERERRLAAAREALAAEAPAPGPGGAERTGPDGR